MISLVQYARLISVRSVREMAAYAALGAPISVRNLISSIDGSHMPLHRRSRPAPQEAVRFDVTNIELFNAHLPVFPDKNTLDSRPLANSLFDARAAAAVAANVGSPNSVTVKPPGANAILENKNYPPTVPLMTSSAMGAMAYGDYFPSGPFGARLRGLVSEAVMAAAPGWCGTYGPKVGAQGQGDTEGNYDMNQGWLLAVIYNYFDKLSLPAREKIITELLARGRIHRAGLDDTLTSGRAPNDWSRAGIAKVGVKVTDIPETENHVLMIATCRYLTNQLLYQRDRNPDHDNRRNGDAGSKSCMDLLLDLLRNYLSDDFAEYNAKNYQEETRQALLNLCSYAYDAEIRLGARMVLDHISAHYAVSSNDLRRIVPFRRRNEDAKVKPHPTIAGFTSVNLLDDDGCDPMSAPFALLAGNTRAYEKSYDPPGWYIASNFSANLVGAALSRYRLPPSLHDLFVNDLHRRFFQRLYRTVREEPGGQRNCENLELYSGSPSYLITAGGKPAKWVIPGFAFFGFQAQNLGVAMPITFMPTALRPTVGETAFNEIQLALTTGDDDLRGDSSAMATVIFRSGRPQLTVGLKGQGVGVWKNTTTTISASLTPPAVSTDIAQVVIAFTTHNAQFETDDSWDLNRVNVSMSNNGAGSVTILDAPGRKLTTKESSLTLYAAVPNDAIDLIQLSHISDQPALGDPGATENYGVAPDFACGVGIYLPDWTGIPMNRDGVYFFDSSVSSRVAKPAGFFLAVIQWNGFALLEALDTWTHPEVTLAQFQESVNRNSGVRPASGNEGVYTTYFGNKIHFKVWNKGELDSHQVGSTILHIEYGSGDPFNTLSGAGNATVPPPFLTGTVMKTIVDGATEIHNAALGTKISLDWRDPRHLVRVAEDGQTEQAGVDGSGRLFEVWVDFAWTGEENGDFFRPCRTMASAMKRVADGGEIRIMPGKTAERPLTLSGRNVRLVAPIRGVSLG